MMGRSSNDIDWTVLEGCDAECPNCLRSRPRGTLFDALPMQAQVEPEAFFRSVDAQAHRSVDDPEQDGGAGAAVDQRRADADALRQHRTGHATDGGHREDARQQGPDDSTDAMNA